MTAGTPIGADPEIVAWVSAQIVPFEAELRHWLRGVSKGAFEADDLVQDIYYRLLKLQSVDHIGEPRAYLYQVARNIIIDQMRRKAVVRIDTVQSLDDLAGFDQSPSPERVALARAELKWVLGLIANLPDRCKEVFKLRKIYGLSQAETARNLRISENIVEKETVRGLALISDMVANVGVAGYQAARKARARLKVANAKTSL
jgi:RNA polymerase sigma-70 factor (ECF subfamily)